MGRSVKDDSVAKEKLLAELARDIQPLAECLTAQQIQSILNYVGGMKQHEAYFKAGGNKMKNGSASAIMSRLLKGKGKPFYDAIINAKIRSGILTKTEALERLSAIARAKITDVAVFTTIQIGHDADGKPINQSVWQIKESAQLSDLASLAIKTVKCGSQGLSLEMYDATSAIKQLAEMEGWLAPKLAAQKIDMGGTSVTFADDFGGKEDK